MSWSKLVDFSAKFDANINKSQYVEILAQYSLNVPSLEVRVSILNKILNERNLTSKNWLNRNQFILGIIYSTLTVNEFQEAKELLYSNIINIYDIAILKNINFKFLDYILSSDWGKTLILFKDTSDEILRKLVESEYYYESDEFAALLLKFWVSSEGKKIIEKNNIFSKTEIFFFKLIDSMKGKTGGLLKEVGFALKGQEMLDVFEKIHVNNLLKYIDLRRFDTTTAYYVIMMALKVLPYDFTEFFNHNFSLNPHVKKMLISQSKYPFMIFSSIQEKVINADLHKYHFEHNMTAKLSEFYTQVLDTKVKLSEYSVGKVGVIITTYNPNIILLESAIQSIINQSYGDIEICLVDDCSSEQKRNDIQSIVSKFSNTILYLENENNIGQYASRNLAMKSLKGCSFFAIQDDDDISHPQRIELQLKTLEQNHAQICLTQQVRFTEDLRYVADKINPLSFDYGPATSLFRSNLIDAIGDFSLVRTRGDVEFLKRIIAHYSDKAIAKLSVPLYLMRYSSSTVSASKDYLLRTQLEVFRHFMKEGKVDVFVNGQQYALNN